MEAGMNTFVSPLKRADFFSCQRVDTIAEN